jgi:hypothetical protein
MRIRLTAIAMVAAVGIAVLGAASPARATLVTYSTTGTFSGGDAGGTSVYLDAANGVQITFQGIISQTVNANPSTSASFGNFSTNGTTAPLPVGLTSGFTLDIVQTAPAPGGASTFVGSLHGTLAFDQGDAFVQFDAPLSQSIANILYQITESDNNTAGRANIVPPSVNNGLSTVEGSVTVNAVPEPSTMVLAGLAFPALLAFLRKKTVKTTA